MVCGRMGLLDDAIREHLELKRLRGANPGEVAREEREALGPLGLLDEAAGEDHGEAGVAIAVGSETVPEPGSPSRLPEHPSTVGQETVELDMGSVLHTAREDAALPEEPQTTVDAAADEPHRNLRSEDSLEWEVPGSQASNGQDGDVKENHQEAETPVEDVLEETPDFLRDTPEQERLWFEQRPPRDFDFNDG
jgi:hypothetical protein